MQSWNHFGHFALVEALLPLLKKTAKLPDAHVRIVNVSSLGHTFAPAKMEQYLSSIEGVNNEMGGTWKRYGASKLYNVLFTRGLQKRLDAQGVNIRVLALHPGNINTELTRGPVASYGFLGVSLSLFISAPRLRALTARFPVAHAEARHLPHDDAI